MTGISTSCMEKTVTVVMPCYNAAATIASAIESVQSQTFSGWQLIVIDDGSRDASIDIAASYAARDNRITVMRQPNSGPSVARNRGTRLADTPYVAFLDSDDMWGDEHLAIHVASLEKDPALGLSFARCRILAEDGIPTGEFTRTWESDVTPVDLLGGNPTSTCSSIVVRRQVFEDAGYMREDMVHAEDQEWLFRVAISGWRLRGAAAATTLYRTSLNGLSADTARMYDGWRTYLAHASRTAPDLVARHAAAATASMNLYYARRLIRTRQNGHRIRQHLIDAVRAAPGILFQRPGMVSAIAIASCAPWMVDFAISVLRSLRHA